MNLSEVLAGMLNRVSAPADLASMLLRQAGVDATAPVAGGEWMARQGLSKQPGNALSAGLGGGTGLAGPAALAGRAPRIGNALLPPGTNALSALAPQMTPRRLSNAPMAGFSTPEELAAWLATDAGATAGMLAPGQSAMLPRGAYQSRG